MHTWRWSEMANGLVGYVCIGLVLEFQDVIRPAHIPSTIYSQTRKRIMSHFPGFTCLDQHQQSPRDLQGIGFLHTGVNTKQNDLPDTRPTVSKKWR